MLAQVSPIYQSSHRRISDDSDLMTPPYREGSNKRCFCPSSVCPSVAYIANNSRTKRPSVPKFQRKVFHLSCDEHSSFKVKQSKVKVTRPINADTHRAPYLPNGKSYRLQLGVQMEDDDQHQPQAS